MDIEIPYKYERLFFIRYLGTSNQIVNEKLMKTRKGRARRRFDCYLHKPNVEIIPMWESRIDLIGSQVVRVDNNLKRFANPYIIHY